MRKISAIASVLLCSNSPVFAAPFDLQGVGKDFQINGFLSVGAARSDVDYLPGGIEPTYVSFIRRDISFEKDTNIGIQITKFLSDDISITTQFLAEGQKEFYVEAVWAFIKYEPNDYWQFRAGRVRTNPYMFSEYVNVGYAYPWVRLPVEVYSQIPFSNFTGVDIKYKMPILHRDFSISAFYGAASNELEFPIAPFQTIFDHVNMRLRHLASFNMRYGDEVFSVRAGYETSRLSTDPTAGTMMTELNTFLNSLVNAGILGWDYANYFSANNSRISFIGVGYELNWKNIVSLSEVVRRQPDTPIIADTVGWYIMGGYKFRELFPHITFARERIIGGKTRRFGSTANAIAANPPPFGIGLPLDTIAATLVNTSTHFQGGAGEQSSVTLGLRWDVYQGVAIKAEYQHVHPDNNSAGLFDYNPHKSVNIYSLAVDAVM